MSRLDDVLHAAGLHALAKPVPQALETDGHTFEGGEGSRLLEHAELVEGPPHSLTGARGRDPGGYPKIIPAGMPPAVFGEQQRVELPKSMEIPPRPPKYAKFLNIAGSATVGAELISTELGFPIHTIQLDNYTSCWIYVYGADRFVPPLTMGWQFPIFQASTLLRAISASPPGITQPALTAGGVFYIFAIEARLPFTAGVTA